MRRSVTLVGLGLVLGVVPATAGAAPRIFTLADRISHADCVGELADGSIIIGGGARVRRLGPDGKLHTVAGTGKAGFSGDGGPAVRAQIAGCGVAGLPGGGFLVADGENQRVRAVGTDGLIRTAATLADQLYPDRVTPLPDGGYVVSIAYPTQSWRVMPDGRQVRIGGIGSATCDRPEPVPATGVLLSNAASFAVQPDGGMLLGADCVLRIAPDGMLTVAAPLPYQRSLAPTADGGFLAGDSGHVRRVTPNGAITTVAGCDGDACVTGDGPALTLRLGSVAALAPAPGGGMLLAEGDRVARVDGAGNLTTLAGVGAVSLSVAADGSVLLARPDPSAAPQSASPTGTIVRIAPGGGTSVVAGGGTAAPVTGQPATAAVLHPSQVQALADGSFALFDRGAGNIVVVAGDGTITRVIAPDSGLSYPVEGFGVPADGSYVRVRSEFSGLRVERLREDGTWHLLAGGPLEPAPGVGATAVSLMGGLAPLGDGGFLTLADGSRILRVGPDGFIRRITGSDSFYEALTPGPGGGGLVAAWDRIARVFPDGTLRHFVGGGDSGFFGSSDGAAAAKADLDGATPSDMAPTADGGALLALGSRLLWVAPKRTTRLAVAITRRSLALLRGRRIAVRTTRRARLAVTARRGRVIAGRAAATVGAGEHAVALPRGLAPGVYSVTVEARSGDARATTRHAFLLGTTLPLGAARRIARGRWPVVACRGMSPRRVDCVLDETTEGSNDSFDGCGVAAIVLGRDGVVRWREYAQVASACPRHPERLFRLTPRWSAEWRQAPPL